MRNLGVYYHAIEFEWQKFPEGGRYHAYVVVNSFLNMTALERWANEERQNSPFWVVPSRDQEPVYVGAEVGGHEHVFWNGERWGIDYMRSAPLVRRKDGSKLSRVE